MKSKIIKGLIFCLAGYLILFSGKLVYNLVWFEQSDGMVFQPGNSYYSGKIPARNNYITELAVNEMGISLEQKYEKIAELYSTTADFEKEKKNIFERIFKYTAVVQSENTVENNNTRNMNLVIGIDPDKFSEFVDDLKQSIPIDNLSITKTDKTKEYREMLASKNSLEKMRNSLMALKSKSGDIDEFIKLEEKILSIEQQIQTMGVNLGQFDSEKSLSTVKISLQEISSRQPMALNYICEAAGWACMIYSVLVIIGLCTALTVFLGFVIYEKAKKTLVK
ncbi:MAG: DUF4349 domain-containing protein [Spirochaetales bacterium]|nr:DUF4349 domain-containing protein [Spirochaetales bacterium]